MSNDNKNTVLRAFRLMLEPLVRILLRSGVTWKEAAEIGKATFVAVASREFGLHGRPTNASRVSIMTGLGRREVSRLRKRLEQEEPVDFGRMNSATRVLSAWYTDPDYLQPSGNPRRLEIDGGHGSFSALAARYGGDIAPVTMLRELLRVGAIEKGADERLTVTKRYYMPLTVDPEMMLRAGGVLRDIGDTVAYNLVRTADAPSRFEGRATNIHVRAIDEQAFREYLEDEAQAFLERVDRWLTEHEPAADSQRSYKKIRLGVGVYQIRDDET